MVITISRQFGSGGREIGKNLADGLHIPFYDKELINLAAKESGISRDFFEKYDEQGSNSLLYSLSLGASATINNEYGISSQLPMSDKLFLIQNDIIKKVSMSPCVIVGRCADYVLADRKDCINLFICADIKKRIRYAIDIHKINPDKAEEYIRKKDKSRAAYYNRYTDKKWGNPENYHLCINSGELGVSRSVELIGYYLRQKGMI